MSEWNNDTCVDTGLDTAVPSADITSPSGDVLQGVVSVEGDAYDVTSFDSYMVAINCSTGEVFNQTYTENVTSGELAEWDASGLPTGDSVI